MGLNKQHKTAVRGDKRSEGAGSLIAAMVLNTGLITTVFGGLEAGIGATIFTGMIAAMSHFGNKLSGDFNRGALNGAHKHPPPISAHSRMALQP